MPVDPANNVASTGAPSVYSAGRPRDPSILDKDDFLMLLIGQMRNQDPLNPTDGAQYMAQMTQFSILEQITNLNQTMSAASANEYDQNAISLIGKEITYMRVVGGELETFNGKVESVSFTSHGPQLRVEGEDDFVLPVSVTHVWGPDGAPETPPPAEEPPPGEGEEDPEGEGNGGAAARRMGGL
jgi:flagellar basal-body rod modification protein FlgD